MEKVAGRIRSGTSYREILAALQLATIRNVRPRPSVGYKFHAVLVVNSAHQASLSSPDADRWLPIFWAIDHFKGSQADEKQRSGWRMSNVDASRIPAPRKARKAFIHAMENWDEAAADTAAAGLARSVGAHEAFELFARFAARDFRSIGHKVIFVANGWRTLRTMGWQHAEPVLRSLAYALQNHEGENPAERDADADRPWRRNKERLEAVRKEWRSGKVDPGATTDLLAALREGSADDTPERAVKALNAGVSPQSVWDAIFIAAGELVMRRPNIPSIHAVTTMNAIRYCYDTVADDALRCRLLLQAAAFVPLFRASSANRNKGNDQLKLDGLEGAPLENGGKGAVKEIFADVSGNKMAAARKILTYLGNGGRAKSLIDAAQVLIFLKGRGSHDYKFSSAVLEDFTNVSPAWRNRFLAASVYYLKGSELPDNPLIGRIREALKA